MSKHLRVFLLFALYLGNCGPGPASPTQPTLLTVAPTFISPPTPSAIPASTPYPPLQTQGPHILFTRDSKNLILMDADGRGRKQIQLPNDGYTFLHNAVSPDGNWIAYFTGSLEEPYDVALNIMDPSSETTQQISSLLATDFPENLEPIVETMVLGDPPIYDSDCFEDSECRRSLVQRELTGSIFSFDWSPDSQFLAFTA